jgi:hypothetical protein
MTRGNAKTRAIGALLTAALAACGASTADTTTSGPSTSATSSSVTTDTTSPITTTTGNGATTPTSPASTTTSAATTTTLATGPFGSGVGTEGITAQLSYSLATPEDTCAGFASGEEEDVVASIEFQDGADASVGSAVVICFPGFGGFEDVTITTPGGDSAQLLMDGPRQGSDFVIWTVLPGDALGDYTVTATPAVTTDTTAEEPGPIVATFTVSEATVPGLRVVDPNAARWEQPEWQGRNNELGQINLAYFGVQGTVTVDIYGDPDIGEVSADYVGTLEIAAGSGGAGILSLPSEGEEGFYCFSLRSPTQICDAAVQLEQ